MKIKCNHYWIIGITYYKGTNIIFTQYRYCPKCEAMTTIPDKDGCFVKFEPNIGRYNSLKNNIIENNIEYKLWELEL